MTQPTKALGAAPGDTITRVELFEGITREQYVELESADLEWLLHREYGWNREAE